jgi:hypothetical protein
VGNEIIRFPKPLRRETNLRIAHGCLGRADLIREENMPALCIGRAIKVGHDPKFTNDPGAEGISREAAGVTRRLFRYLWYLINPKW